MIKVYCDRCGQETDGRDDRHGAKADLCRLCRRDFRAWLESGQKDGQMPLAKSEMHWSVLALDPRARNRIQEYTDGRNLPAFTVGDLRAMPDKELLRIKNCGLTTVRQIRMATALHLGLPE